MVQHNNNCFMTIRNEMCRSVLPVQGAAENLDRHFVLVLYRNACIGHLRRGRVTDGSVRLNGVSRCSHWWWWWVIHWNILRQVNKSLHVWSWSLRPFRSCRMVQYLNGSCQGCQLSSVKGRPCHPALGLTANAGGSHLISVTAPRCLLCKVDAAQYCRSGIVSSLVSLRSWKRFGHKKAKSIRYHIPSKTGSVKQELGHVRRPFNLCQVFVFGKSGGN